ncbi:MAG: hypothetical protein FJ387_16135 [Verrucomicrobia bacterium]|nr:hypothetical protein [Verrucomicrobiota bacterium]
MKIDIVPFPFVLLTPCFSGTAAGKEAETSVMRVPPIRGHIRFWHRALFDADSANRVWGSTAGSGGGSLVGVRLHPAALEETRKSRLLPHVEFTTADRDEYRGLEHGNRESPRFKELKQKKAKAESERPALQQQAQFGLDIQRLVGCSADDWTKAQSAVKLWLLLGCLGLRSNRAAGSVWPLADWVPGDAESFRRLLRQPVDQGGLSFAWPAQLGEPPQGFSAEQVRAIASDTKGGSPQYFGDIRPHRQPSPLKLKVVRLSGRHLLLAVARNTQIIQGALGELRNKPRWFQLSWQSL